MILVLLLITAVLVSALVGTLAKLPPRELAAQTIAMLGAAAGFYGLTALL